MARLTVKFRCFRCHQLLGSGSGKIGSVIPCPKCGTELVVPDPVGLAGSTVGSGSGEIPTLSRAESFELSPTPEPKAEPSPRPSLFDLIDFNPEDIRVEPGSEAMIVNSVVDTAPVADPQAAELVSPDQIVEADPEPAPTEPLPNGTATSRIVGTDPPSLQPAPLQAQPVPSAPAPAETRQPTPTFVAPTIVIRARDVVIPRVVMFAWSLFVLVGLGMAFIAGLMVGHFVWVVR